MKLIVLRHGQTNFNVEHRYLGALDPELNANGLLQASAFCKMLPDCVDVVVCSPLLRARQTADIICRGRLPSAIIYDAFRERNVGVFEGLTQQEARSQFPELWAKNVTRQWKEAPTGGETIEDVVIRVTEGLNDLIARYTDKTVVLVAHGFVAKVIRAMGHSSFEDFFEWQLSNGQFFELKTNNSLHFATPLWLQDAATRRL